MVPRLTNPARQLSIPFLLMVNKKGPDVGGLAKTGFYKTLWYLIVAYQSQGCRLGALLVNRMLQRMVVLDEGLIVIEFSEAYRPKNGTGGSLLTTTELARVAPIGPSSLPLEFPDIFYVNGKGVLEHQPGVKTAIDVFHLIMTAAILRCLGWLEHDLDISFSGLDDQVRDSIAADDDLADPVLLAIVRGVAETEGDACGTTSCIRRVRDLRTRVRKQREAAAKPAEGGDDTGNRRGGSASTPQDDNDDSSGLPRSSTNHNLIPNPPPTTNPLRVSKLLPMTRQSQIRPSNTLPRPALQLALPPITVYLDYGPYAGGSGSGRGLESVSSGMRIWMASPDEMDVLVALV